MTGIISANATPLRSRRSLISQAGLLAGMTAAAASSMALPVLANEPGPIERMYLEHVGLAAARNASYEAEWEAGKRYVEPDRPRWAPWTAEGGYKLEPLPDNKCRCYLDDSDENIARLREMIAQEREPDAPDAGYRNKDRAPRARKTLDQIEMWKAEAQRRRDAAGLTAATEAKVAATTAAEEHAAKIFAIEPTNFRELAFRAAVLLNTWDEDVAETLPELLVELAGVSPNPLYV